ncbi:hypothetical protein [Dermacoccus sp. 147Ba]|nr:hypothetical protein [Dermacoccus sp. 147Ba]
MRAALMGELLGVPRGERRVALSFSGTQQGAGLIDPRLRLLG